jgi:hypothetical protein
MLQVMPYDYDQSSYQSCQLEKWDCKNLTGGYDFFFVCERYTVLGSMVNLSARLMQASNWGCIMVDAETYRATKTTFKYGSPSYIPMKGMGLVEVLEWMFFFSSFFPPFFLLARHARDT